MNHHLNIAHFAAPVTSKSCVNFLKSKMQLEKKVAVKVVVIKLTLMPVPTIIRE